MAGANSSDRHRVVIVGGGFGGLFAAKFLRRAPVDVTLIDRTNHHTFQPLLYQVATGILSEGSIAPPLRGVLRKHRNVTVELANVTGFDLQARTVTAARPLGADLLLPYDSLIVAAGADGSYFGHDEFTQFAPGMKTVDDALELRARIFGAFEMAETEPDPQARRAWLTFAVVGAGPTGVEMAGQIAELSRRSLKRDFRNIDPASARVLLLDGGDAPLATFGEKLSAIATREIARVGVELKLRSSVTDVSSDAIVLQGPDGDERIACRTKVWAAGVQASPLGALLAQASGAETDHAGRVKVLPDCALPGHPEVFVVGDMMALDDLPGVAEVAMQSGIHAARAIRRRAEAAGRGQDATAAKGMDQDAAASQDVAAAKGMDQDAAASQDVAAAKGMGQDAAASQDVAASGAATGAPRGVGPSATEGAGPGAAGATGGGRVGARASIASSEPFKYRDLGSMATISRFRAIVSFKGLQFGGFFGWLLWAFVHLTFLTGFKNRGSALLKWLNAFVGSSRDERTITMQQVSARIIAMRAGIRPGHENLSRFIED